MLRRLAGSGGPASAGPQVTLLGPVGCQLGAAARSSTTGNNAGGSAAAVSNPHWPRGAAQQGPRGRALGRAQRSPAACRGPPGPSPPASGLAPLPRLLPAPSATPMVAQPLLKTATMAQSVLATASRLGAQALKQVRVTPDGRGLHRACRRQGCLAAGPSDHQTRSGSAVTPSWRFGGAAEGRRPRTSAPPSHSLHPGLCCAGGAILSAAGGPLPAGAGG